MLLKTPFVRRFFHAQLRYYEAVISGAAATRRDAFRLKSSDLTAQELAETVGMLIRLGERLKISVEELENIDGEPSVYRDTARNEMCVKIKISDFFLAKCWRRAQTQQERKAMWQPLPCHYNRA